MPDVTMRFDAETAKAVDAFLKLENRQKALEERSKRLSQSSIGGMDKMVSKIGNVAASYLSVDFALGMIRRNLDLTLAGMERVREKAEATASAIQDAVAGSGDTAQISRVSGFLRTMPGASELTMAQRTAAYKGVRGSRPTAPISEILPLVNEAARAATVLGPESAGQIGSIVGEVQKLTGAKARDAADLALFMSQSMGKHGESLDKTGVRAMQQLKSMGVSADESMALQLAGAEAGQAGRGATAIASWIDSETKGRGLRGASISNLWSRRGARAPAAVQAVMGKFQESDYVGMLRQAEAGDYVGEQLAALRRDPIQRQMSRLRRVRAAKDMVIYDKSAKELGETAQVEEHIQKLYEEGASPLARSAREQQLQTARGFGASAENIVGMANLFDKTVAKASDPNSDLLDVVSTMIRPFFDSLNRELQKNTEATRANTSSAVSGSASPNHPGTLE